jgi:hypothetical protein
MIFTVEEEEGIVVEPLSMGVVLGLNDKARSRQSISGGILGRPWCIVNGADSGPRMAPAGRLSEEKPVCYKYATYITFILIVSIST